MVEAKTLKKISFIMLGATAGVVAVLAISVFAVTYSYPWHASCKITWELPSTCQNVKTKIVDQLNAWDNDNCPTTSEECPSMPCGQKCLYHYLETNGDGDVIGTHMTPVKRYVDNLSFKFIDSDQGCTVEAFSTSATWYALLDYGTNYCNLRNLLDGTGLTNQIGFDEHTSTSVCTQYDQIDCNRY